MWRYGEDNKSPRQESKVCVLSISRGPEHIAFGYVRQRQRRVHGKEPRT
jgi:hypothetical protein